MTTKACISKKFEGKTIHFGAAFTKQYQSIKYANTLFTIKATIHF